MEFKEVKEFIDLFIENECTREKAYLDFEISDAEYEKLIKEISISFHSIFEYYSPTRTVSIEEAKEDELCVQFYPIKIQKVIPRTLFQIKHYQNPKLGDALKRIITSDDIWACYVSENEKRDYAVGYDTIFYVAETNEGFKIIDRIFYGVEKENKWDNPAKKSEIYQIGKVINAGTLLAVEKYNAPEDEICLKDYNKH